MSATSVPSPLSPTASGTEVVAESRTVEQMPATSTDIQAPSQVAAVTAEFDGATSAGKQWAAQAGQLLESPQGFGSEGYTITMPDPDHDEPFSSMDMMFPHQGP
jgi:hypothetical protein